MSAPLPDNEEERLEALQQLDLTDTPAEDRFDRVTRTAQRVFGVPFAMITLMESERQWFKSAAGHLINETPRTQSFCQYTLAQDAPLIVQDASSDSRYFDLPVVFDMGIKFYAGTPIRTPDGKAIGTLCVLDLEKREKTEGVVETLEDLGRWVEAELQLAGLLEAERRMLAEMDVLRRRASLDPVTRCWTPDAGSSLLERLMAAQTRQSTHGLGVVFVSLEQLSLVNESFGMEAGNLYLRAAADRIRRFAPEGSALSRARTTSFLLLWPQMPAQQSRPGMEKLIKSLTESPVKLNPQVEVPLPACAGMSIYSGTMLTSERLLERAAHALSQAKKAGAGNFRQAL